MKLLLVIAIVCLSAVYCEKPEPYNDKYDTIDLDEVLSNKRLMTAYIKCALDQGKCTPEAKELKSHITEALQSGCERCTKAQRHGMRRVIKFLINYETDYWYQLEKKYDPKKIYTTKYEKELKSLYQY